MEPEREIKQDLYERHFNSVLDKYLNTGTMDADTYVNLTDNQKDVVQVLKRAFKRMKHEDQ